MRRRIIILAVMIGAVAYLPWWFSAFLGVAMIWRFDSSYELLVPSLLADLAYGNHSPLFGWLEFTFLATFTSTLVIALNKILINHFFIKR